NADCVAGMKKVAAWESRRKSLRKYMDPARYWNRLMRLTHGPGPDFVAKINRRLRDRFGLHGDLTAKEIVRIIDPHLPEDYPGAFDLGSEGLSWTDLESGPLAGLRIEAVRTSGYV